jgi:hypothetical protein
MCDEYERAYCSSPQTPAGTGPTVATITNCPHSYSHAFSKGTNCYKFLWIRLALLNRLLTKIIEFVIGNASKYYVESALAADPVDGPIFASLIIGPCTVEYTRIKTYDNFCSDPNADELIQRHKMHSAGTMLISLNGNSGGSMNASISSPAYHYHGHHHHHHHQMGGSTAKLRLGLNASLIVKRKASAHHLDDITNTAGDHSLTSPAAHNKLATSPNYIHPSSPSAREPVTPSSCFSSPKEYVESLHQNSRSQIIYGKNHVVVNQVIILNFYLSNACLFWKS